MSGTFLTCRHGKFNGQRTYYFYNSRMIRWAKYVAHMGDMRYAYKILISKPEGKRCMGTLCIDRRTIWISYNRVDVWIGINQIRIGTSGGVL
jgi:hypothetical protein